MSTDVRSAVALTPYVYLYGKVAEALDYYKGVFGGSYDIIARGENDMISHAVLQTGGFTLMLSDGGSKRDVNPNEGNISLQLTFASTGEARGIFDSLCAGGSVKVPFEAQPWGGALGVVHDRYGTEWIVTTEAVSNTGSTTSNR